MPVHMDATPAEREMYRLGRACRSLEDGKEVRRDITKAAREVLNPSRNAARQAVKAIPSKGHAGPKLRNAVANKVMVQIKLSGRYPGATLRAKKTPNLRRFRNAPKRLNARAGWTHPSIEDPTVQRRQIGKPGWFDDTTRRDRGIYRRAMLGVLNAHEKRIRGRL